MNFETKWQNEEKKWNGRMVADRCKCYLRVGRSQRLLLGRFYRLHERGGGRQTACGKTRPFPSNRSAPTMLGEGPRLRGEEDDGGGTQIDIAVLDPQGHVCLENCVRTVQYLYPA